MAFPAESQRTSATSEQQPAAVDDVIGAARVVVSLQAGVQLPHQLERQPQRRRSRKWDERN